MRKQYYIYARKIVFRVRMADDKLNGNWKKDPIRAKKSEALLSDKQ